ncbi:uncharacterized protein LOC125204339 isoform X3 [Salvia hispanica]|uniref:uncharacterized protein LOC125204339 isoform X3 n=1 Tax=Salvia hispanica TaxID=49212 RepID=UPI002009A70C|nr:uncharacterized protein LOC125204339 isoform X3 [Salvia hispanica]
MAAYGALLSLMQIIDTLEKHPSPPIFIDTKQVESLTQIVTFLLEFLDVYISPVVVDGRRADPLERRIADAVYKAEDVIESQIVRQIDSHKADPLESRIESSIRGKRSSFLNLFRGVCGCTSASPASPATEEEYFYSSMQEVIKEMNLIKKEVMEIEAVAQLRRQASSIPVGPLTNSSIVKDNMMVGFDEVFLEVLDKLTGYQLSREIIPITGMGGIDYRALLHVLAP